MSKNLTALEPKPGAASFVSRLIRQAASFITGQTATYDEEPWFNNQEMNLLAAGVQAVTVVGPDLTNHNGSGVSLTLDTTVVPGVTTTQLVIEGKDPASGKYYQIAAAAASAAVRTDTLVVYPGIAAVANQRVSDVLPRTWRYRIIHSAGGNFTYSLGGALLN